MKKIISIILAVSVVALAFSGCALMNEKRIVGTWVTDDELEFLGAYVGVELEVEFDDDGTGSFEVPIIGDIDFEYQIDDDKLTIKADLAFTTQSFDFVMSFEDGNLILADENGKEYVFVSEE